MKFKVNAGLVDIQGLTPDEFDVLLGVVEAVDRQCFSPKDFLEEGSLWCSGDGLTLSINEAQRLALTKLGNRIRDVYNS